MGEFELIRRYFQRQSNSVHGGYVNHATEPSNQERGLAERLSTEQLASERFQVTLGIGDDCALFSAHHSNYEPLLTAVSTDLFIEGRHFFVGTAPYDIGYKALAVNLSDLAAMGAKPQGFTLALSLPDANEGFLSELSRGLFELADRYECPLIGGDTTKGPLSLCITVFGSIPSKYPLRRDGAQEGDDVWVSGFLGAPAWLVAQRYVGQSVSSQDAAVQRLDRPEPRVPLGLALRGIAHSALDLSDGLIGDAAHIARASGQQIVIELEALPLDQASLGFRHQTLAARQRFALAGGDDYELLFTAPPAARSSIEMLARELKIQLTPIGCCRLANHGDLPVTLLENSQPWSLQKLQELHSFEHF
jgi:thiamine-monophosphate kinase